LAINEPVEYVLLQALHNVLLGYNLFPITCVCGIAHDNAEWNVLTAMKQDIGDCGTLARAALSEKS
jgi:hypothetical protein